MISSRIKVLADKAAVVEQALDLVTKRIYSAAAEHDICSLAVAGGSTPKPLYEAIAKEPLPWDALHVFWGDERYVPADHADSNERMVRQAWLNHVPIPAANIHPVPTTDDPQACVDRYENELQMFFHSAPEAFPRFDVVLLGMGDDGHTASLFPHTPALEVSDRLVTLGEKSGQTRISFTAPLINRAHCVIVMVSGAGKAAALAQVLRNDDAAAEADLYPARLIKPEGELWWLVDEAAAAQLSRR